MYTTHFQILQLYYKILCFHLLLLLFIFVCVNVLLNTIAMYIFIYLNESLKHLQYIYIKYILNSSITFAGAMYNLYVGYFFPFVPIVSWLDVWLKLKRNVRSFTMHQLFLCDIHLPSSILFGFCVRKSLLFRKNIFIEIICISFF